MFLSASTRTAALNLKATVLRMTSWRNACSQSCDDVRNGGDHFGNLLVTLIGFQLNLAAIFPGSASFHSTTFQRCATRQKAHEAPWLEKIEKKRANKPDKTNLAMMYYSLSLPGNILFPVITIQGSCQKPLQNNIALYINML